MFKLFRRLNSSINDWFSAPEAAGRLGLFRILYSAFYLWHLSTHFGERLSGFQAAYLHRVLLVERLPDLPPAFFALLESCLVGALVMLMIGFRVRLATAIVLFIGCILEAVYTSIDVERATVFLVFYIPFFMLLNGRWGCTYSLDALFRRRVGEPRVEPSDPSWCYFLPARSVLVSLRLQLSIMLCAS